MARSIWKGTLAFGLVSIPVELHIAVRDHRPKFRMLHAADKSPVKLDRVCARDGKSVAWQDLVKGYEYSKGHFVVMTKDDFAAAAVEKTRRVDILDFVEASEIDDRFFETPYYIVPGQGGDAAYALLREAMRATGRTGIAKFVLRETMHLAAVEVIEDALVLTLMRFADELVDTGTLAIPARKAPKPQELEMAKTLVQTLASEWDPAKYTDDYRDNLMKVVKAKLKGKTIEAPAVEAPPKGEVVNLMERLRQSLDAARAGRPESRKARAAAHKPAAARRSRRSKSAA